MNPLVSVVVPVYKVENEIRRCLDSLCRQSLYDIEIILIDDASPDKCGKICEAYSEKDKRFRLIHNNKNYGLSVARNIGIANARCDYLMFVDSDDWVHEDFCKKAYECAKHYQADIVIFSYERIGVPGSKRKKKMAVDLITNGYKTKLEAIDLLLKGRGPGTWTTWNKMYRKELFKDNMFPPGYFYEDIGTTYKTFLQASRIYYLNESLYYNCYREDSITTQKTRKAIQDWIDMHIQQYNDLKTWGGLPEQLEIYFKNIALTYCIVKKPDLSNKSYIYCSNILRNSKMIPSYLSNKRKLLLFLFNYCPQLFELICTLFNKKVC